MKEKPQKSHMDDSLLRILLIEDDEDDYVLVRDLLSDMDDSRYDLQWAATYDAALEALRDCRYDVYLLDYRLGERNGLDLLHQAIEEGCTAPIIFLTGQGDYKVDFEAMKAGAADYLVKAQISAPLLERSIRYAVERKRSEDRLRRAYSEVESRVRERTGELARVNEALQTEVTKYRRAEEQIKMSLKEKEVLLKEIHHRVKNNLQVISSLLNLQARSIRDERVKSAFRESQNRIQAMLLIHETLYQSENLAEINLGQYIRLLTDNLLRVYYSKSEDICMKIRAEPVTIGMDQAIPCGLIVNEVVSNSLKYAFPGKKEGEITIDLHSVDNGQVELVMSDDGAGIPEEIDFSTTESLGLKLIAVLVEEQIAGTLELDRSKGTQFTIRFKKAGDKR